MRNLRGLPFQAQSAQSARSAVSEKANVSAVFPKILYLNTKSNQDRTANCKASPGNYLACGRAGLGASAINDATCEPRPRGWRDQRCGRASLGLRRSVGDQRCGRARLDFYHAHTARPGRPVAHVIGLCQNFFEMCQKCEILKYFKINIDIHISGCYYSNCHKTYVTQSAGKARRRWL